MAVMEEVKRRREESRKGKEEEKTEEDQLKVKKWLRNKIKMKG